MGRTSRHAYFNKSIITTCRGEEKKSKNPGDFPGSPVVKTLPSNTGDEGSVPGQRAKILHASQPKDQNIKQSSITNKYNKDGTHQKKKKNQNITLLSTITCNRKLIRF